MTFDDFLADFQDIFCDEDVTQFTADTVFRDLEEWSSLMALSVLAMIDENYGIKLRGDDIRNAKTIGDIYTAMLARKA